MAQPDIFHNVRVQNSNMKASHFNVQCMEYRTHSSCVDEYQYDMLEHLMSFEQGSLPNLQLIQQQPEINLRMRPLLLDFLMDVINKLHLSKSTFPLTVNLIDRYCSTRIVKKQHYQLLGLTSLWISCKNFDSKFKIPSLYDLCKMCCNCYDKKLFLEMENHLLKSLNWSIDAPTFDAFIDLFLNMMLLSDLAGSNGLRKHVNEIKVLSIYICELIQFYPNIYFNYSSSQISLGVLVVSMHILDIPIDLHQYFDYFNDMVLKEDILPIYSFSNFFQSLLKILKCPPPSLKLKYFNDKKNAYHLMKLLIDFTNRNIKPLTPRVSTVHLPPTPVSNNISPKETTYHETAYTSPILDPVAYTSTKIQMRSPPYVTRTESNVSKKRSLDMLDVSHDRDSDVHLKRSRSMEAVFYIS